MNNSAMQKHHCTALHNNKQTSHKSTNYVWGASHTSNMAAANESSHDVCIDCNIQPWISRGQANFVNTAAARPRNPAAMPPRQWRSPAVSGVNRHIVFRQPAHQRAPLGTPGQGLRHLRSDSLSLKMGSASPGADPRKAPPPWDQSEEGEANELLRPLMTTASVARMRPFSHRTSGARGAQTEPKRRPIGA